MRVLVVEGAPRAALATVRSLGRQGYTVFVACSQIPSLASVSRYTHEYFSLPALAAETRSAVAQIRRIVDKIEADLVIPTTDVAMDAILRECGESVGGAPVAGPSLEAYEAVTDKCALVSRARALGLTVPQSIEVTCAEDVRAAVEQLGYPCVIKPHRSKVLTKTGYRDQYVRLLTGPELLEPVVAEYSNASYPVLVQEKITGPAEAVSVLMHCGKPYAAFAHRRLREFPPSGGASTLRESIPPPADLNDASLRLLRDVGWRGVAMVEYKRAADTGEAFLMEINGRLWGSLQLAIDAGVDFPVMLARLAVGDMQSPIESYRESVRTRWLWGDIDHLLERLRHSRRDLNLAPSAPSAGAVLWDVLVQSTLTSRSEVLNWSDLRPFLHESARWSCRWLDRLRARARLA